MADKKEATLKEQVKALSTKAMIAVLERSGPNRSGWNLLIKRHPDRGVQVKELLSYDAGRAEQERVIKNENPLWTALVRDKRR